ncbi:MAG: response regulator [Acidobacteria bacterium]|nr:response regulator [Acidobacteriota bacterium]MBV9476372.1 response regulator [Acidobacteriota bacterium]
MTPKELRSRRLAIGLSLAALAGELGVSTRELEQMEDGRLPLPPHRDITAALEDIEVRIRGSRTRDFLVVEDDTPIRKLFVAELRKQGCTVDEAADGYAALDAAAMRDYRMLLLDLRLPKLSGAEVLARVSRKPGPPAQVIVISAAGSGDVREVANHRAVHAILKKSFAIENAEILFPALAALTR